MIPISTPISYAEVEEDAEVDVDGCVEREVEAEMGIDDMENEEGNS